MNNKENNKYTEMDSTINGSKFLKSQTNLEDQSNI